MGLSTNSQWLFERIQLAAHRWDAAAIKRPSLLRRVIVVGLPAAAILFVYVEMQSSWVQSRVLASVAARLKYSVAAGPSPVIHYPDAGPYDPRLGYFNLPAFFPRLQGLGLYFEGHA